MYDAIIIGAGMSGLAAGVRLAHFGRRVCILERHRVVGGLNSFYRRRGRDFDVGLHALTNFQPKGARRGPLARLLRQLRFSWDELALCQQVGSQIRFPEAAIEFSNDFALFESEVARCFPGQVDGLRRLVAALVDYNDIEQPEAAASARQVVGQFLDDPLLVEMIFCPLCYYGGPTEHDMEFGQFSIMFRSIFLEGLARPAGGVRLLLDKLVARFEAGGGELCLGTGVQRIEADGRAATRVVLDDGRELTARHFLSSAGWPETMRLCGLHEPTPAGDNVRLTFVESISVLDRTPAALGHGKTLVFFNDTDRFCYARPDEAVDLRSGVICVPNNFVGEDSTSEGVVRITALANNDRWAELGPEAYRQAKQQWYGRMTESAVRFMPDFRPAVVDSDMFTPTTIRRYTGHDGGAVYGEPRKHYDGQTPLENLYICGTDQGFVGIVGTIVSGIGIANQYVLRGA